MRQTMPKNIPLQYFIMTAIATRQHRTAEIPPKAYIHVLEKKEKKNIYCKEKKAVGLHVYFLLLYLCIYILL